MRSRCRRYGAAAGRKAAVTAGPADLMDHRCDVVITCLRSLSASDAVMWTMLPAVSDGKIWLEMSTMDEFAVRRHGEMVTARGGMVPEYLVSGGCHRAATGQSQQVRRVDVPGAQDDFPADGGLIFVVTRGKRRLGRRLPPSFSRVTTAFDTMCRLRR